MTNSINLKGSARHFKPFLLASFAAITILVFFNTISYRNSESHWLQSNKISPIQTVSDLNPSSPSTSNTQKESPFDESYTEKYFVDNEVGYSKYVFENNKVVKRDFDGNTVLVISSIFNGHAYGKGKDFNDFFHTITDLTFNMNQISMGILVGDEKEFNVIHQYFVSYFNRLRNFDNEKTQEFELLKKFVKRATIIYAPFLEKFSIDRENRHSDHAQKERRRNIARLRNFLVYNSLHNERYSMTIDSDIVKFHQKDMLETFIATGKDIIVPRVQRGGDEDYDRNSWVGERTKPTQEELEIMDKNDWKNFHYIPRDKNGKLKHIFDLLKEDANKDKDVNYLVQLDSVGGAVLFLKSAIFKQGIPFPPTYVVGTTWDRDEGYDGIETEGVCYLAKPLGYTCWGMPNVVAEHNNLD